MFAYHDPRIRSSNGNAAEVTFVQAPVTVLKVLVVCECNVCVCVCPIFNVSPSVCMWLGFSFCAAASFDFISQEDVRTGSETNE